MLFSNVDMPISACIGPFQTTANAGTEVTPKYGGLEENEARRLKTLEEENWRLKKIVAQQALDLDALKAVLSKKW